MNTTAYDLEGFSPKTVHRIVSDLMRPRLKVYWADFLLSMIVAVGAFAVIPVLHWRMPASLISMVVLIIALYRAFVFLHEIVHFRSRRQFARFRLWWNLLCGIPLFMPVFMFEHHADHHSQRWYGTSHDAEYIALARMPPREIVKLLASVPLLPLFGPLRFGVLTPVSWFVPRLRTYVYENLSALKLDLDYKGRPPGSAAERRSWMLQEMGCLILLVVAAIGFLSGVIPWIFLLQWYVMYAGLAGLDTVRLLGAHRYRGDEESMSVVDQMLDTYNYPRRRILTELWAPVGLRLHALHHLLPGLPYHSYQEAHLRLVAQLPESSPYRTTESDGLLTSLATLWRTARTSTTVSTSQ